MNVLLIIFPFVQDGWTPLHLAIQSRNRDIVKVLLVNGVDKTRRTKVCLYCFISLLMSNIHQKNTLLIIAAYLLGVFSYIL